MAKTTKNSNVQKYESKQHPGTIISVDLDSFNPKTKTYFADYPDGKSISINSITLTRWWTAVEDSVTTDKTEESAEVVNASEVTETDVKTEETAIEQIVDTEAVAESPRTVKKPAKKSSKKTLTEESTEKSAVSNTSQQSTTESENSTVDVMLARLATEAIAYRHYDNANHRRSIFIKTTKCGRVRIYIGRNAIALRTNIADVLDFAETTKNAYKYHREYALTDIDSVITDVKSIL